MNVKKAKITRITGDREIGQLLLRTEASRAIWETVSIGEVAESLKSLQPSGLSIPQAFQDEPIRQANDWSESRVAR